MNRNLLLLLVALLSLGNLFAQNELQVSFFVNDRAVNIERDVVTLKESDELKIRFHYGKRINIKAIKLVSYTLVPVKNNKNANDQQQPQKMAKMKLSEGKERIMDVNCNNTKDPVIVIPIKSIYSFDLSKLKINILNCTDEFGNKLHRNNRSYEMYMPIYEQMKKMKLLG